MNRPLLHTPHVEQVIISLEPRGEGTEADPCRTVTRVYTLAGEFIAENDPAIVPPVVLKAVQ